MPHVVILSLGDGDGRSSCDGGDCGCGHTERPRVPVLTAADVLRAHDVQVNLVTAGADAEIDTAIKSVEATAGSLIVAAASDGEVRAVIRRLVRRHAPPPSKRPVALPAGRTIFDLPAIGILPLSPAVPALVTQLGLPADPQAVALATLAGQVRRLDLLRTDAGSVTLHGSLLGGVDRHGAAAGWRGRVEVDDVVLTDGAEPVLACAVRNLGSADIDGLPLIVEAISDDGLVDVAVAVPTLRRRLIRPAEVQFEVRRARGRAVSVTPYVDEVQLVDDGISATLTRKRAWWVEQVAWGVYVT